MVDDSIGPPVEPVPNHVTPYWPTEVTTASDSEDPGGPERLRVETRVNVELHPENKLNHVGERDREAPQERDKQTTGNGKDTAPVGQANSNQQPEQRKGTRAPMTRRDAGLTGAATNFLCCLRYPQEQDQLPAPPD